MRSIRAELKYGPTGRKVGWYNLMTDRRLGPTKCFRVVKVLSKYRDGRIRTASIKLIK